MHMDIMVTDIIMNISPATIRTVTATLVGTLLVLTVGSWITYFAFPALGPGRARVTLG